jgi:ketosteroid isomerase-like protein
MSERDAVLFAHAAFYAAFSNRDMKAMGEAWSKTMPVSCIHPGWDILHGREAVLQSWQGILRNPKSPKVKIHNERVTVCGDTAIVTCVEDLDGDQFCIATNVFTRDGSTWHLVHHHGGPANMDPSALEPSEDEKPLGPIN